MPPVPEGSRRAIRRAVSIRCEVVCERAEGPLCLRATELSPRGAWLQTACPMRAGEVVVFCFALDDGLAAELMIFAQVARVATARGARDDTPGVGMGLELLDATVAEQARIDRFLARRREPVPRRRRPLPAHKPPLSSCWR